LATAVDGNSKPILKWDSQEQRNQVSWFMYHQSFHVTSFGLIGHQLSEITGITPKPDTWFGRGHGGDAGDILIVDGCTDKLLGAGLALFPEFLRAELHSVRSTIEAHSNFKRMKQPPAGKPWAVGLMLSEQARSIGFDLVVQTGGLTVRYHIDRWD